ncbi:MAG: cytochrome c1 [Burkholderiales bacterium]|nr:cytochrome c1 [Burkholderiales bacterium]
MTKKILLALLVAFAGIGPAVAAGGPIALDPFPKERVTDMAALQNGARLFVNYCLNCHSAAYMRYNRMREIGLSEEQIRNNLMFAGQKVGDPMTVTMNPVQAKDWFGAAPPDLTVVARSRASEHGSGADYLYTYMRSFYRDDATTTGWNNTVFPSVAMPHVLWELQGEQRAVYVDEKDPHDPTKTAHVFKGFELAKPGTMTPAQYNEAVADLVAFMQWMGEPHRESRVRLGVFVLLFLGLFTVIAWRLNAAYWKDVK